VLAQKTDGVHQKDHIKPPRKRESRDLFLSCQSSKLGKKEDIKWRKTKHE